MVLLFPGSFKPFHDGHFLLLKRYIEELQPEKVYIIISNKNRSGITAESTEDFIKIALGDRLMDTEINVEISPSPSPINYCYKIIGNDPEENEYTMVNSSKDSDKRIEQFYELFKKGGKYYHDKSYAVKVDIDIEPIFYNKRKDEFKDAPISSAIVRNDIINGDFKNFKKAYEEILNSTYATVEDLEDYFEDLSEITEQNEDDIDKLEAYKEF